MRTRIDAGHTTTAKPSDLAPVFHGSLSLDLTSDGPRLLLTFHCPHCRGAHTHAWPWDSPDLQHRHAHCWRPNSPYSGPFGIGGTGYLIGPANTRGNRRLLDRYASLVTEAPTADLAADRPADATPAATAGR